MAGKVLMMPAPNVGNAQFFPPPPLSWLFAHRARALHRLVRADAVAVGAAHVHLYRRRADDPFARDVPPPRCWVAERIFGRMMRWRRLVRNYEQRIDVSRQMIYVATGSIFLKRLFDTN